MWKNPLEVLTGPAMFIWICFQKFGYVDPNYASTAHQVVLGTTEAHDQLHEQYRKIVALYEEWLKRPFEEMTPNEKIPFGFIEGYAQLVKEFGAKIRRESRYDLIPDMHDSCIDHRVGVGLNTNEITNNPSNLSEILNSFATAVQIVLGNEREFLVGTRGGRPTFKRLEKPLGDMRDAATLMGRTNLYSNMRYLQSGDEYLVPEPHEWAMSLHYENWPAATIADVRQKLEDSYYNQRYLIDPAGAFVRISGYHPLESINLKVRRGLKDPNYYDFLVRFNFTNGSHFHVLDSEVAQGEMPHVQSRGFVAGSGHRVAMFLNYLTAQIYHDLVTAIEIPITRSRGPGGGRGPAKEPEEDPDRISWIYIPRVVRGKERDVRRPVDTPQILEPHRVRGHKRRGRMSESHRAEIEKFERETGLQVFTWLPAGHTFVRPHISPVAPYDWMAKLPRFIKARLQRDIEELLSCPVDEDPPS